MNPINIHPSVQATFDRLGALVTEATGDKFTGDDSRYMLQTCIDLTKAQLDVLLTAMEEGDLIMIGALYSFMQDSWDNLPNMLLGVYAEGMAPTGISKPEALRDTANGASGACVERIIGAMRELGYTQADMADLAEWGNS
jgi:hypothetical protein